MWEVLRCVLLLYRKWWREFFLHAYPPEMASLPREREKNKQLQASYSTSIVQRIIQKFFLLSFLFLASGGGGGGAPFFPVMYVTVLYNRVGLKQSGIV